MIIRRKFLIGAASLFAAPAIVRVESLMPVKVMQPLPSGPDVLLEQIREAFRDWQVAYATERAEVAAMYGNRWARGVQLWNDLYWDRPQY
jgi:hypothetical protein